MTEQTVTVALPEEGDYIPLSVVTRLNPWLSYFGVSEKGLVGRMLSQGIERDGELYLPRAEVVSALRSIQRMIKMIEGKK